MQLRIIIAPLLDVLPIVGCLQVFITQRPKISWKFAGIAAVPGLEDAIVGIVDKVRLVFLGFSGNT